MGLLEWMKDLGDRENVKTAAMRIDVGIHQIKMAMQSGNDTVYIRAEVNGLVTAIKEEIYYMTLLAEKLSQKSIESLKVQYDGREVYYRDFLNNICEISKNLVEKGFKPLVLNHFM